MENVLFSISRGSGVYITWARSEKDAVNVAQPWLGGNPEKYHIITLSRPGDRVRLDVTLSI